MQDEENTSDKPADSGYLGPNAPAIRSILHDHLHVKKLCLWVPHSLTEKQMTRSVTWSWEILHTSIRLGRGDWQIIETL
ncbi:hypothetical protein NPIL_374451 [Nephila pilipes]|uniref:Uncharacterized protein n=1 Tax=Nephila pilipes TaxID=299642 RepID=A0A8X6TC18_NEPPI|nr:hypothetical protein NPIL_374451 [Nephila pilipes]